MQNVQLRILRFAYSALHLKIINSLCFLKIHLFENAMGVILSPSSSFYTKTIKKSVFIRQKGMHEFSHYNYYILLLL